MKWLQCGRFVFLFGGCVQTMDLLFTGHTESRRLSCHLMSRRSTRIMRKASLRAMSCSHDRLFHWAHPGPKPSKTKRSNLYFRYVCFYFGPCPREIYNQICPGLPKLAPLPKSKAAAVYLLNALPGPRTE